MRGKRDKSAVGQFTACLLAAGAVVVMLSGEFAPADAGVVSWDNDGAAWYGDSPAWAPPTSQGTVYPLLLSQLGGTVMTDDDQDQPPEPLWPKASSQSLSITGASDRSRVDLHDYAYSDQDGQGVLAGGGGLIPGDCDLDGDVDWADYQLLEAAFGTETGATWAEGDFDADGDVDWADYQKLEENFGNHVVIPEPATLGLLALGLIPLLRRRRS